MNVSDRTWNASQSWWRERLDIVGETRLRVTIRVNAYTEQSYGRVHVWKGAGEGWVLVHSLAGDQLQTKASYVVSNVKASAFDTDVTELRRVAMLVLGLS